MTAGFLLWAIVATVLAVVLAVSLHESKAEVARQKRWFDEGSTEWTKAAAQRNAWEARALEAEKELEKEKELLQQLIAVAKREAWVTNIEAGGTR